MESDASPSSGPARNYRWATIAQALLVVALVAAVYLAWVAIHHGPVAGCGPESGCSKVLGSRWAYWLDLPVSAFAVLAYAALLTSLVLLRKRTAPDDERGSWAAIIILSVVIAGAGLWFIGLQALVLHAFCKFCLTAHSCAIVAAIICLSNIRHATDPGTPMWAEGSGKRGVPRGGLVQLILLGLLGVGVLAGGQLLKQKERNVVKELRPPATVTNAVAGSTTNTDYLARAAALAATIPAAGLPSPRLVAPRVLSLYSNSFLLKLDELPMIGSRDASNIVVSLFDYTCPHCRALEPILRETQQEFGTRLGIVCLPMPLSTSCNPFLGTKGHVIPGSCEYARLGLAVWHAAPEAHEKFSEWAFAPEIPPPVEEARKYAAQLIGEEKLAAALTNRWVEEQIITDCRLHFTNWVAGDNPGMPQLILGDSISAGPLNNVNHFEILLHRYLRISPDGRR